MPVKKFLTTHSARWPAQSASYLSVRLLGTWSSHHRHDEFEYPVMDDEILDSVLEKTSVRSWLILLDDNAVEYDIALVSHDPIRFDVGDMFFREMMTSVLLCLDLHGETLLRIGGTDAG